ncbi:hypothetical protein [Roseateles sp.]|uniref:hypothetical protein n=1 Tax=Roseateles sp. TaxID=1971397 RepID=UPI0025EA92C4|nr:hypothetical protein [Roseateles sp.]MBV8036985.1 hypothetical protein [Roseateles sp.]
MLRAGRVDFWLVNDLAGRSAIQHSDGPPPSPLHGFGRIDLHLACHRDVPAATADRLRRGLEQMRRDGELAVFGPR